MTAAAARAPFLDLQSFVADEAPPPAPLVSAVRSPFVSVYEFEGMTAAPADDPVREAYAALVDRLHDEAFDDAVNGVQQHLRAAHQARLDQGMGRAEAERATAQQFAPLLREAEAAVDTMAREFASRDTHALSEGEVDGFVSAWSPSGELEPEFEDFLGGLVRKIGGAVKAVAGQALAGIQKLGLAPVFAAIRRLLNPLLKGVLQRAIGHLPAPLQAPARQLAAKLGFTVPQGEVHEAAGSGDPTVQQQLDEQIAASLLAADEAELDGETARVQQQADDEAAAPFATLDAARERFVQGLQELEDGTQAQPLVQQFLPAVLPALRVGLKLAGRQRVIDFLSGLLAKLVGRLVGPQQAPALSKALVDAGFKLMSLEAADEAAAPQAAASAVAATVEETIARVAALPESVLDNEAMLEGFALEAFEQAAAANLPALFAPALYRQRPELLEGGVNAGWVMLPLSRGGPRYKRCTKRFALRVTPYMAAEVESFEGAPLADHLVDQLGLPEGGETEAEVQLYEALPGTSLADIGRGEAEAGAPLHPLTPQAAAVLLGAPGLGRALPAGLDPQRLAAGQRFYRLVVPGRRVLMVPGARGARPRRLLHVGLTLDGVQRAVRVCVYVSEVKAQKLAQQLKDPAAAAALVPAFRRWITRRLHHVLRGPAFGRLRAVHAALRPGPVAPAAWAAVPEPLRQAFAARLEEALVAGFAAFAKTDGAKLQAAAADPAEGLTLRITVPEAPGLAEVLAALAGRAPGDAAEGVMRAALPAARIEAHPGHRCG